MSDPFKNLLKAPCLSSLDDEWLGIPKLQVSMVRLDLLHPTLSGNKLFKLKHHIEAMRKAGKSELLSFGGAYSNHLHALAYAARELDVECKLLVRGHAPSPEQLSPTLKDCLAWGAEIEWLSRDDYRMRNQSEYLSSLQSQNPQAHIIPEGGGAIYGVQGFEALMDELNKTIDYDFLICPVGSGTTLAGLISGARSGAQCLGFSALKNAKDLEQRVTMLLEPNSNSDWKIIHDYHFGGFAKLPEELVSFVQNFYRHLNILLDPIYTSKMMFGLVDMCRSGYFSEDTRILALHTGGLQGWRGFEQYAGLLEFYAG